MSSYFHSARQSCPILPANCRYNLRLFRLFRGDSSGMDKSSSAKCLSYSDVMKGEPSPTGRGRRSRDEKGNQGVGDIRFTNILQLFSIYFFFFFQLLYFITFFSILFFTHDIYPHSHPRPTTSTYDSRPTTFSYTPPGDIYGRPLLSASNFRAYVDKTRNTEHFGTSRNVKKLK